MPRLVGTAATASVHRRNAIARERSYLQPALCDDRTYSGRRKPPAGIGVIVHLGDRDVGMAARLVERSAHDQRSSGIALDQEDHLAVAQQRCQRSRHSHLRIAAGHDDDEIGTVDGRSQIACCALDGGEPGALTLDIDAAEGSDVGKPRIVDVVQPQLVPGDPSSAAR